MLRLFQSTRPGGARLAVFSRGCRTINVSIHAPRRGATFYPSMSSPTFCVSIHAPRRGATFGDFPKSRNNTSFNPRAPAGRDFLIVPRQDTTYQFQSTRPGGARHSLLFHVKIPHIVSIHAPRRGATSSLSKFLATFFMFQSTRPGGARRPGRSRWSTGLGSFNPRAPAGRDSRREPTPWRGNCFNPRAPAGRDCGVCDVLVRDDLFQSTRPGGARRDTPPAEAVTNKFQSTRPGGARRELRGNERPCWHVSIHAPRRGATRASPVASVASMFQSTRPGGARHGRARRSSRIGQFQSTRPGGARPTKPRTASASSVFQSTRPGGARLPLPDTQAPQ